MSKSSHSDDHADSDVSFDESEIRQRLNQMDKESLIDFMRKKGNERKQAIYDWMIFQTKDAEFSEIFVGKYEDKVEEKRQKLQEIDDGVNKFSKIFEEAEQDLEKCNQEIEVANKNFAEANEGLQDLQAKLKIQAPLITDALLKAISKQLGSGKPSWGDIVEHFTGIIKNIEEVNPKQVQALLKDHKILSAKLEKLANFAKERTHRLNHTKVHVDAIKAKSDDYKETKAKLGAKMEDGHIRPIIDWSLTFGEYAAKIQQLEAATHEINAHQENLEAANYKRTLVAEPLEQLEKHEMLGEYKRDIYEHAQKLVSDFEALAQRDATQCEQYQQYYFGFEKKYFKELQESYKNKNKK